MKSEYEYVMSAHDQLGEHLGKWIAVVNNRIVSTGSNANQIYQEAKKKHPDKVPFIMKIPEETTILL